MICEKWWKALESRLRRSKGEWRITESRRSLHYNGNVVAGQFFHLWLLDKPELKKKKKVWWQKWAAMATRTRKPRTQREKKHGKVSQNFVSLLLSSERHLMFLGHSVKDKSPGGSKEGRAFANLMAFFVVKNERLCLPLKPRNEEQNHWWEGKGRKWV